MAHDSRVQEGEFFEFETVVDSGGHDTYRILLRDKRADDPEFTEKELLEKGLALEIDDGDFFAIDVPPSVDQNEIDVYLTSESRRGRWGLQDGCLSSVRTNS